MKGKKVVITGGAGFIGSNLAAALYKHNKVVVVDDLSSGRKENMAYSKNDRISFIKADISRLESLKSIMEGVDYVFHLAAIPSVLQSISNPHLTNDVNVNGTMNVLVASKENGVKKVVFTSSAAVYGNIESVPITEDMHAAPNSPYGVQKLGAEHYCRVFYEVYGLATTSLRLFNVFGPNQDPSSQYSAVIPKFIMSLKKNTPPTIYGDGNQTRDFIFVEDVVSACILAAGNTRSNGMSINIAGGRETTVNDLASMISEKMDKSIEPVHSEAKKGEIRRSFADISLADSILGFSPKFSLDGGLDITVDHFNKQD